MTGPVSRIGNPGRLQREVREWLRDMENFAHESVENARGETTASLLRSKKEQSWEMLKAGLLEQKLPSTEEEWQERLLGFAKAATSAGIMELAFHLAHESLPLIPGPRIPGKREVSEGGIQQAFRNLRETAANKAYAAQASPDALKTLEKQAETDRNALTDTILSSQLPGSAEEAQAQLLQTVVEGATFGITLGALEAARR